MDGQNYDHFRSRSALQAGLLMWQIFPPILIVLGTIGNVLSIMVLLRPSMRKTTYTVYLLSLAVADLCMLYIGLLRQWIKYTFDVDIRFTSPVVCKIHLWAVYTNADVCSWILTAITVERLISTLCPTNVKLLCTITKAKICIVGIVLLFSLINAHIFYGFGVTEVTSDNVTTVTPCAPKPGDYAIFFEKVWSWVDLCKASVIPFIILCFGNAFIIWKLVESSKRVSSSAAPSRSNTSKMLIALNFVFIVCTAPVCIYFIGDDYWIPASVPRHVQANDPLWAVVNLLLYINNTINFLLYCLSGSKFRKELKKLFTNCKLKPVRISIVGLRKVSSSSSF